MATENEVKLVLDLDLELEDQEQKVEVESEVVVAVAVAVTLTAMVLTAAERLVRQAARSDACGVFGKRQTSSHQAFATLTFAKLSPKPLATGRLLDGLLHSYQAARPP